MRISTALMLGVLLASCATVPAPPPVERRPALLMFATTDGAALYAEELEMVRRATADFLRRQADVPISLVSDLLLAAVTKKHQADPTHSETIQQAWRAQYPDALVATVTARCTGARCYVIAEVDGRTFVAAVVEPTDVQTWVAAVGSLAIGDAPAAEIPESPAKFRPAMSCAEASDAADQVVLTVDAKGSITRCYVHSHRGIDDDQRLSCLCEAYRSLNVEPGARRMVFGTTPAPTTSDSRR